MYAFAGETSDGPWAPGAVMSLARHSAWGCRGTWGCPPAEGPGPASPVPLSAGAHRRWSPGQGPQLGHRA